nr:hypothetical protein CFP56_19006 [Quercus suber]
MVLRSRKIIRAAVVEAVGPCGDGEDMAAAAGPCEYAVENLSSSTTEKQEKSESESNRRQVQRRDQTLGDEQGGRWPSLIGSWRDFGSWLSMSDWKD